MNPELTGRIWYWKGPTPWHVVTVPEKECLGTMVLDAVQSGEEVE